MQKIIAFIFVKVLQNQIKFLHLSSLNIQTHLNIHTMKAQVKTKSNYKGLNGQILTVKEISGTRVSCEYFCEEFQRLITIDFTLTEIVKFFN